MPAVPSTVTSNPPKKQRAKQKLFQCTGYDNCNMVFTRSEHLARHTRKHTGEKPYLCVVPGCTRRFSRFDNMMQHTQTHKSRSKSPAATSSSANTNTNTSMDATNDTPNESTDEAITTTSPTPTTTTTHNNDNETGAPPTTEPLMTNFTSSNSRELRPSTIKYEPETTPEFIMSSNTTAADSSDEEGPLISRRKRRRFSTTTTTPTTILHPMSPPTNTTTPPAPLLKELHLTQDEFEALQGFGRFKHTPIFIDSFRDLASAVYIDPNPVRN
ncbi:uncharacterized protein ATC70_012351 [Mucor velutinosus]|uniref:C2H2-type domain-containing protein n=1 Tax=Mucor velutinosus TaxID=708070 RepID=A0AAN7D718_9FUNG|nr:hypothetical protein ATC70_012351 [Mucor velutinosus]